MPCIVLSVLLILSQPNGTSTTINLIYRFPFLDFFFFFFWPHPWHVKVPRLGVETELQLLAYTTTTPTWDPSHVCLPH